MARPIRIQFPGAVYHITSRGNARQSIFKDDYDRKTFLKTLGDVVDRYNWLCHSYCLMDNHYHLLIETLNANLSLGMRQLNGVYTQYYNRRHKKPGHIFQGRFKSILVDRDSYLLELCRYIVLNPVRAGMVGHPEDYKWSSYCMTAGHFSPKPFLETEWVLGQFGKTIRKARAGYVSFVNLDIKKESPWNLLKGQCILGEDDFISKIEPLLKDKFLVLEIPKRERLVHRPPIEEVLSIKKIAYKRKRDKAVIRAHKEFGYTLKEISEHLGLHYSTISKIVNK